VLTDIDSIYIYIYTHTHTHTHIFMCMIQQSKKTLTLKMKAGTVMLRTAGNCWCTDSVTSRYIMDWFDLEVKKMQLY